MLASVSWTLRVFLVVLLIRLIWQVVLSRPMLSGRTGMLMWWVLLRTSCPGHTFGLRASSLVTKVVGRRYPSYVDRQAGSVKVVVRVP